MGFRSDLQVVTEAARQDCAAIHLAAPEFATMGLIQNTICTNSITMSDVFVPKGQHTLTSCMKVTCVDDILYSQASCSSSFQDGHQFNELIGRLGSWEFHSTEVEFLRLRVVEYHDRHDGRLISHSLNNRRLYCLKQHQSHVQHLGWKVKIKVVATNVSCCRDMITLIHRLRLLDGGSNIHTNSRELGRSHSRTR